MSESQTEAPFVLPSQVAVHRYVQMKVESVLNTPYQVTGNVTPVEHFLSGNADVEETLSPLNLPEDQFEIAQDILEDALEGGDVEEIYGYTGGALNILMPMTYEEQDRVLGAVRAGEAGMEMSAFLYAPNELFSSLSPAFVWAGAGKHEMALIDAFLKRSWAEIKENDYPSPGVANTEWLSRLRLWSYNPAVGYPVRGRNIDIIRQERQENLTKRLELCKAREVTSIFEVQE